MAKTKVPDVMSFYHRTSFRAEWKQIQRFIGKDGKIATMPDIVLARLGTKPGEKSWEGYFVTLTAEFFGFSKTGKLIVINAHGIGPLSTLDGILKVYDRAIKSIDYRLKGGRITQQEFWDLEAGKFGEVIITDFEEYCRTRPYAFCGMLKYSEAKEDPILKARLGSRTQEYLDYILANARKWHRKKAFTSDEIKEDYTASEEDLKNISNYKRSAFHRIQGANNSDPHIIEISANGNNSYFLEPEYLIKQVGKGYAMAHLIDTSAITEINGDEFIIDVGCWDWNDGTSLVAIRKNGNIGLGIKPGVIVSGLLEKHWTQLLVPVKNPKDVIFYTLMKMDNKWFTEYPKNGKGPDTNEPEHLVTSIEKIGKPVPLKIKISKNTKSFRYSIENLLSIAPVNTNAYFFIDEPKIKKEKNDLKYYVVMIQFYKVQVDSTKRVIRYEKLAYDYERIMSLLENNSEIESEDE